MVELEKQEQDITSGWVRFKVKSIGANIQEKHQGSQRTVWTTLEAPDEADIFVALQLHPGSGPVPENSLQLIQLHDLVKQVHDTLREAVLQQTTGDW